MKKRMIGAVMILSGWLVFIPELLYELNICTVSHMEAGNWVEYSLEEAMQADLLEDIPMEEVKKIGRGQDVEIVYESSLLKLLKKGEIR